MTSARPDPGPDSRPDFGPDSGERQDLLSLRNIVKAYPGVMALDGVSLDFRAGEVHALLGENGAGKSTLIKTISGAVTPTSGEIIFGGVAHDHLTPSLSQGSGIEVIYQEFNLVPTLSAAENICLGEHSGWHADFTGMRRRARDLFAELEVGIDPDRLVRELSSSEQQLVEIAKAIAKGPRILIMDEPTAPLSLAEVETLFRVIRKLKDQGTCIIYISHRLDEIFALADRVSILRDGRHVATLETAATNREDLVRLMVGRTLSETYPARGIAAGKAALELKGLKGNGNEAMSFRLHHGEILGVAGLIGAGRTELARLIIGAAEREAGDLLLEGRPVRFGSPREAVAAGIFLIPENRKEEGCFLGQPIRWNIAISALRRISSLFGVNRAAERNLAEDYYRQLRVKAPDIETPVGSLSGGNQQKVVIAKTLASKARVLIFDEPTRGIDVGARGEIYRLMVDLARDGIAILMITSDMEELLGMSDRVLVLHDGRAMGILPRADCTQEVVMSLASGLDKDSHS